MALDANVARLLDNGQLLACEVSAATHIPFTRFLGDGVVATRGGDVCAVFELTGLAHSLMDEAALTHARAAIARAARQIGDGGCALYTHTLRVRLPAGDLIDPVPGAGFDAQVDAAYRDQIAARSMYQLRHFVTLVRRPMLATMGMFGALAQTLALPFSKTPEAAEERALREKAIQQLESDGDLIEAELVAFGIRRLGADHSEKRTIVSFFTTLATGLWPSYAMPISGDVLSHDVAHGRLTFMGEYFRYMGPAPGENRYGAVLAIQGYDDQTHGGMFDDLLGLNLEFILSQSFAPLDRVKGGQKVRDARSRMLAAADDAVSVRAALDHAVDAVAAGRMAFGQHHFTLSILTETREELASALAKAMAAIGAAGLKLKREDLGMQAAWWAQLPGNFAYQARSTHRLISNENFADFCAFHTHPSGERHNLPWGGPITVFPTLSATPYYFSFHAPGTNTNGNTLVFGPPGTGKTAIAGFLIAQSRRLPRPPRVIYFDKDCGAEATIRAMGGDYMVLGAGGDHGFNPFALVSDKDGAAWLSGLIERIVGRDLTPEQSRRIGETARRIAETGDGDAHLKTFSEFVSLLRSVDDGGGASLSDYLRDWTGAGERAWLFDNPEDGFTISDRAFGVDMTSLLGDPKIRSAALDYLFYRIERMLEDGYPTMIVLDEGWRLLDDARFASRLRDWLKTIRKLNGVLVFMTQEPADAAKTAIAETLIQSAETMLFFANPKADHASYVEKFRLSEAELAMVRSMIPAHRGVLIRQSSGKVVVRASIENPDAMRVFSGTAESVKALDAARAAHGEDWLAPYLAGAQAL